MEHMIKVISATLASHLRYKTLHEYTIQSILLHPAEMGVGGTLVVGREYLGVSAILILKLGGV